MFEVIKLKHTESMQVVSVICIYKSELDTLLHKAIITNNADALIRDRLTSANLFFLSSIVQELMVNNPATDKVKNVNNTSRITPVNLSAPNNPKIAINADRTTKTIVNTEIFFFMKIPSSNIIINKNW